MSVRNVPCVSTSVLSPYMIECIIKRHRSEFEVAVYAATRCSLSAQDSVDSIYDQGDKLIEPESSLLACL
jgi:hypothetical protein